MRKKFKERRSCMQLWWSSTRENDDLDNTSSWILCAQYERYGRVMRLDLYDKLKKAMHLPSNTFETTAIGGV
jgi:hypothetical protein